jgi:hypothetical protein
VAGLGRGGVIGDPDLAGQPARAPAPEPEACDPEVWPQVAKILLAAFTLWPRDGKPPAILGARERNRRIWSWLLENGLTNDELPSKRTLQRCFRSLGASAAQGAAAHAPGG